MGSILISKRIILIPAILFMLLLNILVAVAPVTFELLQLLPSGFFCTELGVRT